MTDDTSGNNGFDVKSSPVRGSPRHSRDRSLSPPRRELQHPQSSSSEASNPGTNLFVSSLSLDVRDEDLLKLFDKFGKIDKCQVMMDPRTKESRGFGFVNFVNVADADAALSVDGTEFLGRRVIVQKAKRQRPRTPTPGEYRGPPKERIPGDRRGGGGGYDRDRYDPRDRYERDRFDPRDRYERDRYDPRGGYDRERYDPRDRYDAPRGGYDGGRDRYDSGRPRDRYDDRGSYGRDRYDDRERDRRW